MKLNALQKKQLKFLEETKKYFLKHPRAEINGTCRYNMWDGEKNIGCAIGRCIRIIKRRERLDLIGGGVDGVIFRNLPKKLQKLGERFLMDIQNFHDIGNHWKKAGPRNLLTVGGEGFYESMKRRIVKSKKY